MDMDSSKDKWEDSIRKKLENYEVPADDRLWQSIERDLPKSGRLMPVFVWKVAAVAACVAILAGAYLLTTVSPEAGMPVADTGTVLSSARTETAPATSVAETAELPPLRIAAAGTAVSRRRAEVVAASSADTSAVVPEQPAVGKPSETAGDTAAVRRATAVELAREFVNTEVPADDRNPAVPQPTESGRRVASDVPKWHLAVAVSNRFGSAGNSSENGFSPLFTPRFGEPSALPSLLPSLGTPVASQVETEQFKASYYKVLASTIDNEAQTEDIYKLPVTYSASFRYMIDDHWGVNVGLSYAVATSERRSGSGTDFYTTTQKMHFLGLPLSVSYTFLDTRFLTLYALAGGSVEKCLSATRKDVIVTSSEQQSGPARKEKLDARPWQGSLSVGAGLQFNISDHYGLFAEPELVYDLSESGSMPLKRRNDFGFQLAVGLRVSY